GAQPGASVDVKLRNHAFNFGTAVAGTNTSANAALMDPNPAPGSNAANYQAKIREHFNAVVPENAGKWIENEFNRDSQWHPQLDRITAFAQANGLRMRAHNLIWDNQQPNWVNTLVNQAQGGNQTARNDLRQEISERIDYYVGGMSQNYYEIDVYNEMVHTPKYWNIYGPAGIAGIYNEVAQAAAPGVRIATNEYNVFQDTGDFYGNWYKNAIEQILAADGTVSAIGIQSYENNWAPGDGCWCSHYPVRKMQTLQNLSVLDMPITLTEFGVKTGTSPERTSQILSETMRLMFGSPQATGVFMWGFWQGSMWDQAPAAALYDNNWNLTLAGQTWMNLMNQWNTDLTTTVDAYGNIVFDGFWGDYDITIGGETFSLTLDKGTTNYALTVVDALPGDFDFNGVVDGADFLVWQRGGSPQPHSAEDLAAWVNNFAPAASSAGAGVPEPGCALLAAYAGALMVAMRRRAASGLPPHGLAA
ncbi:MAG TPA: endo-1,4-beta-xylanase, partial [Lacipirellulaceae bacterium]|nr:endo-1,4-beta-xylanase [Lacipirellulaceae bacterium]